MVQTAPATSTEDSLITLKLITARTGDLPPLPATAMKAMEMTRDPKVTARDLQSVISQDQALSARILRIVNSAAYGFRREVSTVSHAVALLGMETVRSIIIAASIQLFSETGMKRVGGLGTKLMADHSWGAAIAARLLAQRVQYGNREEAFLCGLMHDIGKPVLLQGIPVEYLPIVNDVYRGETTFHESEMLTFGFCHAQVGAHLAAKWSFPRQLLEAIGYHHDPLSAPRFTQLACITGLSNKMMIFLEVGFERNQALRLETSPEATFLKLNGSDLNTIVTEVRTSCTQMTSPLAM
jgi:putative nucleotidyltransferase with HDIG domain